MQLLSIDLGISILYSREYKTTLWSTLGRG
eukprot:COSAG02_NODE_61717_length_268_cov_0.349112_1_plen_29_part_01